MNAFGILILTTFLMSAAQANTLRIGNGGDTQSDGTLSVDNLTGAIYGTNRDLQLLLHAWIQNNSMMTPMISSQEKVNLLAVVRTTPVDIVGYDACHDGIDNKDAVAYSQPSNRICVSLFQLKNKLNASNYKNQILALMIHEYSHLIGFNEDRAEGLQNDTLQYINSLGYPVAYGNGSIDNFTLLDPYSRFNGMWSNKSRLSEELTIYITELKAKMADYQTFAIGNYPTLPTQMNYTGDILLRLNYLTLVTKAYWQSPINRDVRSGLEKFLGNDQSVDLVFFNNSNINPSTQPLMSQQLSVNVINSKSTETDLRNLILQIDALKRQMEIYMTSVLYPTDAKFTYWPNPPAK